MYVRSGQPMVYIRGIWMTSSASKPRATLSAARLCSGIWLCAKRSPIMRVLLLHPEDNFSGRWKHEHWDWIVDLGRAPKSFYDERSAEFCCPVSSIYDFAVEIEDLQVWRDLLAMGMGRVVDRLGVDWWSVV